MDNHVTERYKKNISRVSANTLSLLNSKKDKPSELAYFTNVLKRTFVDLEADEQEYIASYCVMVPEEIIYAFGYKPLRLCAGHSVAALIGEEIVPRDACPVIKALTGFHEMCVMPAYNRCIFAVLPMTCDGKRKNAALMSKYLPVFPFPLAMEKSEGAFEQNLKNMQALVKTISAATGRKLSGTKLIDACNSINAARKEAADLYSFLSVEHPPIAGSQVAAVINSYCCDTPERWTKHTKLLNAELSKKTETTPPLVKEKPRIFIAGSPIMFPNYKLPLLLENLGAQIIGDDTCMSERLLHGYVIPNGNSTYDILRALTARYISACACPVFEQAEDKVYGLAEKLRRTKAEGVIYHVLRGCTPYDFEFSMVEQDADQLGIPVLRIETDFSTEDSEQVRIRLEAFVEMIEQRR